MLSFSAHPPIITAPSVKLSSHINSNSQQGWVELDASLGDKVIKILDAVKGNRLARHLLYFEQPPRYLNTSQELYKEPCKDNYYWAVKREGGGPHAHTFLTRSKDPLGHSKDNPSIKIPLKIENGTPYIGTNPMSDRNHETSYVNDTGQKRPEAILETAKAVLSAAKYMHKPSGFFAPDVKSSYLEFGC